MESRSLTRELALLLLGQISEANFNSLKDSPIENLFYRAIDTLTNYWRENLDMCFEELKVAQKELLDSEFDDETSFSKVRDHLTKGLSLSENVLNSLSSSLEFPRLLLVADQDKIRKGAIKRVTVVLRERSKIDNCLDDVMEGWRLKRLPKVDQDILRLAFTDLFFLSTPAPVACNEAVELANKYSDDKGRRMINGVLRRLQDSKKIEVSL